MANVVANEEQSRPGTSSKLARFSDDEFAQEATRRGFLFFRDVGTMERVAAVDDERILAMNGLIRAKQPQEFFAALATEARRPSFGEMQSGWLKNLLIRAQEAQLYLPEAQ